MRAKRKGTDYKWEAWESKEWDALINLYFDCTTEEGAAS